MTLLVTACASQNTTPQIKYVYVDSACTAFKPIITHVKDPDVMDIRTVRAINTHNDTWDKLCAK
ncbi:hypothetical protein AH259_11445 [Salmonella enterica subsp. enterica]|nr:hypothetical protein [Salmonella enterica subsp. enterica]